MKSASVNAACENELAFRCYMKFTHQVSIPGQVPEIWRGNRTLKRRSEWEQALADVRRTGLVPHYDRPKNWDALIALSAVLSETRTNATVLDAGAELYSPLLPCLFLYGYRNLFGLNLGFRRSLRRGPIQYEPGDLTHTHYENSMFDAVTCLSVIEHGVDLPRYFKEMSRILKPGGLLVTSTDYWPDPLDNRNAIAYGVPVKIFTAQEIETAVDLARDYGFEPTGAIDLKTEERVVNWQRFGLEFTFVIFSLHKTHGIPSG